MLRLDVGAQISVADQRHSSYGGLQSLIRVGRSSCLQLPMFQYVSFLIALVVALQV